MTVFNKKMALSKRKFWLFTVSVEGESAWPALLPSRQYFATCLLKPKIGDFIVFHNPKNKEEIFVKKVRAIERGGYFVEGTLSWASSSEDFGIVPKELVLGKIISRRSIAR